MGKSNYLRAFCLATALGFTGSVVAPSLAHACGESLCVTAGKGAKWKAGGSMSAKQIKKERRKNRKRKTSNVSITIDGGRGSVFVDGYYKGTAPISEVELKPGKHDIQVRNGDEVLAEGVLTVPRKSTDIEITVSG